MSSRRTSSRRANKNAAPTTTRSGRRQVATYKEVSSGGEDEDFYVDEEEEPVEEEEEDYYPEYQDEEQELDEDDEVIPVKSKRISARLNNIEEPQEDNEEDSEPIEDDIEDDKDLVREEKLRMRRALAERKLQEDKRLVLNKLLKRRVGATRGNASVEINEDKEETADNENSPQSLKKVKLPRRLEYKPDGSVIYHIE